MRKIDILNTIARRAVSDISMICKEGNCSPSECPFAYEEENGDYNCFFEGEVQTMFSRYMKEVKHDVR